MARVDVGDRCGIGSRACHRGRWVVRRSTVPQDWPPSTVQGLWFATLIALLLQNRTNQPIQPRTKVLGFSQVHQIDVTSPVREIDPRVCAETKVTGAPAFADTPAREHRRGLLNRRKELKFAPTDLKLYRRQQKTAIAHWGVAKAHRQDVLSLWAARLKDEGKRGHDDVARLAKEAQALINSYLDGAGLVAWRTRADQQGYEPVRLPLGSQVTELDDVLYRIETEIKLLVEPGGPSHLSRSSLKDPRWMSSS